MIYIKMTHIELIKYLKQIDYSWDYYFEYDINDINNDLYNIVYNYDDIIKSNDQDTINNLNNFINNIFNYVKRYLDEKLIILFVIFDNNKFDIISYLIKNNHYDKILYLYNKKLLSSFMIINLSFRYNYKFIKICKDNKFEFNKDIMRYINGNVNIYNKILNQQYDLIDYFYNSYETIDNLYMNYNDIFLSDIFISSIVDENIELIDFIIDKYRLLYQDIKYEEIIYNNNTIKFNNNYDYDIKLINYLCKNIRHNTKYLDYMTFIIKLSIELFESVKLCLIKYDKLDVLVYIYENIVSFKFNKDDIIMAVLCDNYDITKYILESNIDFNLTDELSIYCSYNNNFELLELLYDYNCQINKDIIYTAIEFNNQYIINLIYKNNINSDYDKILLSSITKDCFYCFKLYFYNINDIISTLDNIVKDIIDNNDYCIRYIKYLNKIMKKDTLMNYIKTIENIRFKTIILLNKDLIDYDIDDIIDKYDIIKYLLITENYDKIEILFNGLDVDIDKLLELITIKEEFKIINILIKYIQDDYIYNILKQMNKVIKKYSMRELCKDKELWLNIIQFIRDKELHKDYKNWSVYYPELWNLILKKFNYEILDIIYYNEIDKIDDLIHFNIVIDNQATIYAIRYERLEVLKKLLECGLYLNERCIYEAVNRNNIELVKFIYDKRREIPKDIIEYIIMRLGDYKIFIYLNEITNNKLINMNVLHRSLNHKYFKGCKYIFKYLNDNDKFEWSDELYYIFDDIKYDPFIRYIVYNKYFDIMIMNLILEYLESNILYENIDCNIYKQFIYKYKKTIEDNDIYMNLKIYIIQVDLKVNRLEKLMKCLSPKVPTANDVIRNTIYDYLYDGIRE